MSRSQAPGRRPQDEWRSDYHPATMSAEAQRLGRMRAIAAYWRTSKAPGCNGFDAAAMVTTAERACRDIAAGLIAAGIAP